MKLLLDTHALLWWLSDDDNIGGQARASIADPGHNVLISVVSVWEIAVKLRLGKLEADFNAISDAVGRPEFSLLNISVEHLLMLGRAPGAS